MFIKNDKVNPPAQKNHILYADPGKLLGGEQKED